MRSRLPIVRVGESSVVFGGCEVRINAVFAECAAELVCRDEVHCEVADDAGQKDEHEGRNGHFEIPEDDVAKWDVGVGDFPAVGVVAIHLRRGLAAPLSQCNSALGKPKNKTKHK